MIKRVVLLTGGLLVLLLILWPGGRAALHAAARLHHAAPARGLPAVPLRPPRAAVAAGKGPRMPQDVATLGLPRSASPGRTRRGESGGRSRLMIELTPRS